MWSFLHFEFGNNKGKRVEKPNASSIYVTEKDTSSFVRLKMAFVPKPKWTLVVCVLL